MDAEKLKGLVDPTSQTWESTIAHVRWRSEGCKASLLSTANSHDQDLVLKGKIAAFTELLSIATTLEQRKRHDANGTFEVRP